MDAGSGTDAAILPLKICVLAKELGAVPGPPVNSTLSPPA